MCRMEINAARNAVQENKRENHANREKKMVACFRFLRRRFAEKKQQKGEKNPWYVNILDNNKIIHQFELFQFDAIYF